MLLTFPGGLLQRCAGCSTAPSKLPVTRLQQEWERAAGRRSTG